MKKILILILVASAVSLINPSLGEAANTVACVSDVNFSRTSGYIGTDYTASWSVSGDVKGVGYRCGNTLSSAQSAPITWGLPLDGSLSVEDANSDNFCFVIGRDSAGMQCVDMASFTLTKPVTCNVDWYSTETNNILSSPPHITKGQTANEKWEFDPNAPSTYDSWGQCSGGPVVPLSRDGSSSQHPYAGGGYDFVINNPMTCTVWMTARLNDSETPNPNGPRQCEDSATIELNKFFCDPAGSTNTSSCYAWWPGKQQIEPTTFTYEGGCAGLSCGSTSGGETPPPPPPSPTSGTVSVNAPSGMFWELYVPGGIKTGSGNSSFPEMPAGDYILKIVGGWSGRVVTDISPSSEQTLKLTDPNTGTTVPPVAPTPSPPQELCGDNKDNDGDGAVDEGCPRESCDDNIDNDGDGQVNEGCGIWPGPDKFLPGLENEYYFTKPLKIFAFAKKVLAQSSALTFDVLTRAAQKLDALRIDGAITGTYHHGNSIRVSANGGGENAGKTVDLYKQFTVIDRAEQPVSRYDYFADDWRGIVTDGGGSFDTGTEVSVTCLGQDGIPSTYYESDFVDTAWVVFDQGDDTGDNTNFVYATKKCGGNAVVFSKDTYGNPLASSWTVLSKYKAFAETNKTNGSYRVDRGNVTLDVGTPPTNYEFEKIVVGSYGAPGGTPDVTCYSEPCMVGLTIPDGTLIFTIYWKRIGGLPGEDPPGGEDPPPTGEGNLSCVPSSPTTTINRSVTFYGRSAEFNTYTWSAPGGSPSSAAGATFSTSYATLGTKTVTVTASGKSATCTVDVVDEFDACPNISGIQEDIPEGMMVDIYGRCVPEPPPPPTEPPTVDLKINGSDGEWVFDVGDKANLFWWPKNADTCSAVASPAFGNWSGAKAPTSTWESLMAFRDIDAGKRFAFTLTCRNSVDSDSDTVYAKVNPITPSPTLNVTLSANPASGTDPLSSTLSAIVFGTETGLVNYHFWWNCVSTASTLDGATAACGAPNQSFYSKGPSISTVHSFTKGTYTPKVVATRGGSSAEDRATVSVTAKTCPEGQVFNPETGECEDGGGGGDVCPNLNGDQETVPRGMFINDKNECVPLVASCPDGGVRDPITGECDVCPNLTGTQTSIPAGYAKDASGNCINVGGGGNDCTFTANPKLINRGGSSVLVWECDEDAISNCSISGLGSVSTDGSRTVTNIQQTTSYTLSCEGLPDPITETVRVRSLDEEIPE